MTRTQSSYVLKHLVIKSFNRSEIREDTSAYSIIRGNNLTIIIRGSERGFFLIKVGKSAKERSIAPESHVSARRAWARGSRRPDRWCHLSASVARRTVCRSRWAASGAASPQARAPQIRCRTRGRSVRTSFTLWCLSCESKCMPWVWGLFDLEYSFWANVPSSNACTRRGVASCVRWRGRRSPWSRWAAPLRPAAPSSGPTYTWAAARPRHSGAGATRDQLCAMSFLNIVILIKDLKATPNYMREANQWIFSYSLVHFSGHHTGGF